MNKEKVLGNFDGHSLPPCCFLGILFSLSPAAQAKAFAHFWHTVAFLGALARAAATYPHRLTRCFLLGIFVLLLVLLLLGTVLNRQWQSLGIPSVRHLTNVFPTCYTED